jgi:nickel-dependent lactate racemase
MNTPIELTVGRKIWSFTVPTEALVKVQRQPVTKHTATPGELMRAALNEPLGLNAPLHRAVTPDDKICVVLDEQLPHISELLEALLQELSLGSVLPNAVTVLVPPNGGQGKWIDELPEELEDITIEVHDVEVETKRAYLATTKAGRRVYLNRTLVEADYIITLTGRRYDPTFGYAGAEVSLFPTFADGETLAEFVGKFNLEVAPLELSKHAEESLEIAWLLGTPTFIQVIEGAADTIQDIVATLPSHGVEGIRRQNARWRGTASQRADLVIAAISGDPERITFEDLANALNSASRVVSARGKIALLTEAGPTMREGAELLRSIDELDGIGRILKKRKPDDWAAAAQWVEAAQFGHLFLASDWPDEVVEELFATPFHSTEQLQKLIDSSRSILIIPDAHKTML